VRKKNLICIRFNEIPPNTHFTADSYSWVTTSTAIGYIVDGYAEEFNPYTMQPERKDKPTMNSRKDEIIDYLEQEDIEHDPSNTKQELIDLIDG